MRAAVIEEFPRATTVIMAAAVADYSPVRYTERKIKRGDAEIQISLKPNPDILRDLATMKKQQVLIGFAAETEDLVANARRKLQQKSLDLIVANDVTQVGSGFDVDTNAVTVLDRHGGVHRLPLMSKRDLAERIYDFLPALKSNGTSQSAKPG
jgi:phosphopantothenoylcysteine decarboxylase/phosphopantothenate--cysteine ligase